MKTLKIKVYTYDELDEKAKDKARDWYWSGGIDSEFAWDCVRDDAKEIGLKIISLDAQRNNEGEFLSNALATANKIMTNHGKTCETYKTPERYIEGLQSEMEENREDAEHEFLHDLLEDYRVMFDKEIEYQQSEEYIKDMMQANEYTFTAGGKRLG